MVIHGDEWNYNYRSYAPNHPRRDARLYANHDRHGASRGGSGTVAAFAMGADLSIRPYAAASPAIYMPNESTAYVQGGDNTLVGCASDCSWGDANAQMVRITGVNGSVIDFEPALLLDYSAYTPYIYRKGSAVDHAGVEDLSIETTRMSSGGWRLRLRRVLLRARLRWPTRAGSRT
ncbi:MAG: hypothetical protein MZV63_15630 [Marinilabiliales bacterium]|nr:hypothetical protein [Marinilabiliales bacterium]